MDRSLIYTLLSLMSVCINAVGSEHRQWSLSHSKDAEMLTVNRAFLQSTAQKNAEHTAV